MKIREAVRQMTNSLFLTHKKNALTSKIKLLYANNCHYEHKNTFKRKKKTLSCTLNQKNDVNLCH